MVVFTKDELKEVEGLFYKEIEKWNSVKQGFVLNFNKTNNDDILRSINIVENIVFDTTELRNKTIDALSDLVG